jgi:glycosyltransferase involved in cell wall biosynthesis
LARRLGENAYKRVIEKFTWEKAAKNFLEMYINEKINSGNSTINMAKSHKYPPDKLYSICITCRNNASTVKESLESILSQINSSFEIIVVDSKSDDGTTEILQDYARKGIIKLIVKKCSRGRGRQIAFENSCGKYIIANMDLDDVFKQELSKILKIYHRRFEGYIVSLNKPSNWCGITIGPRSLIEKLGGWRDLQFAEEWDLWARAAKLGLFRTLQYELREKIGKTFKRNAIQHLINRLIKYREMYRLGRRIFAQNEKITISQKIISYIAFFVSLFYPSYVDPFNREFDPASEPYIETLEF